ncbi:TPA: hypothetical protein ACGU4U_003516 [Vibrio vulnificus]|uniref:hypothetical protein n=1 Tax=Vibrio TaxID=662 RepID=UPI0005EDD5A8|nr:MULTISPECIES: hypothetical protein [Vibrio]EGR2507665.1 hypothetical protein [Vibrio cholerae]EIO4085871.1 hypothetical protein [Vibrio parahaemolyticus]EJE3285950.1 hypothetical protein [Vibrio alginolyticus]HAS6158401.1 hypothetical protein [Vibrio vulnificus]APX07641.1 hypothetical protein BWP24_16280 [Vibrio campbellii]
MSKVIYLSDWKHELCIQLNTSDHNLADFNRLLVKGCPSTRLLQQGGKFESANREHFILQLKHKFDEEIQEGASHNTLYYTFKETASYLSWSDAEGIITFTQSSLERYMSFLQNRVMLGSLKRSTYKKLRSQMVKLFVRYLELPSHYFDNIIVMDNKDTESFEAYTRSDLNQLLPFLRQVFKQTYKQLIENPDRHINAHSNQQTMTFEWKGEQYWLCAGISKMMCAATFILAYYTYTNTSDLFQLKQPSNASMSMGEEWYTMPAFKRRAFKTIQVEMGGHELDIPKYALNFFDNLLNASRIIRSDSKAMLLQTVVSERVQPLSSSTLQSFLKIWVEKHFTFIDQTGRRLRPVISRFRETGTQLTAYHQGEMVNDIMLNNTPQTRKRNYSKGNKLANNGMMQDTISIREEQIKSGVNSQQARENLSIKVLVIEDENKIRYPELSRTANGGSCTTPFGKKSEKYTKKAKAQGLLAKEGEKLACADLLGCFGCASQAIVQSISDIWCLLSFKACIEESLYFHLDASHYRKNFEAIVQFIEQNILPNLRKRILRQAEAKLNDDGLHPAWDSSESVLALIPNLTDEIK